jgi:MoaA/NifB/PqqE/SkfB family radical SAM enzyme
VRNPLRRTRRQIEVRPAAAAGQGRSDRAPTICCAPEVQVDFRPNGDVRVCCRNETPLGNVRHGRFAEMWAGSQRQRIVDALGRNDFGAGCGHCGAEVEAEGREGSYPAQFDLHLPALQETGSTWPRHMEFTLSINCNLQCGQCSGDLSSAIRVHREGRAPLPAVYDDQFFEDLREFLPHLASASFSGGEPFLAEENFRVWDLLAELNPDVPVTIVTNATQWTPRVQAVLERLRCSFRLSVDGATPEVYESIRVGASFDRMRSNVDQFVAYGRRRGTEVGINHCLMRQNAHEFLDLLVWADSLDVPVHVSVVRNDTRIGSGGELYSIVRSSTEEISRIAALLESQDGAAHQVLGRNLHVWNEELHRVRSWASATPEERRGLVGVSGATVLMFNVLGDGPTDDDDARAELAAVATDGQVHAVWWGPGEVVVEASPSWSDVLGRDAAATLVGRGPRELVECLEAALGPIADYRVTNEGPNRVDATARFGSTPARLAMLPLRNDEGWAGRAVQLIAFGDGAPLELRRT